MTRAASRSRYHEAGVPSRLRAQGPRTMSRARLLVCVGRVFSLLDRHYEELIVRGENFVYDIQYE